MKKKRKILTKTMNPSLLLLLPLNHLHNLAVVYSKVLDDGGRLSYQSAALPLID